MTYGDELDGGGCDSNDGGDVGNICGVNSNIGNDVSCKCLPVLSVQVP